jgi:hypothetical protein
MDELLRGLLSDLLGGLGGVVASVGGLVTNLLSSLGPLAAAGSITRIIALDEVGMTSRRLGRIV